MATSPRTSRALYGSKTPRVARKPRLKDLQPPTVLRLTDSERLNLLRLAAEIRAYNAQLSSKQQEAAAFIKSIDPEGKYLSLLTDVTLLQGMMQRHVGDNNQRVKAIGERLDIDMTKFVFDPETGVLRELEAPSKDA